MGNTGSDNAQGGELLSLNQLFLCSFFFIKRCFARIDKGLGKDSVYHNQAYDH
jgi:hypothetical protein